MMAFPMNSFTGERMIIWTLSKTCFRRRARAQVRI